jgi:hypothetical protein
MNKGAEQLPYLFSFVSRSINQSRRQEGQEVVFLLHCPKDGFGYHKYVLMIAFNLMFIQFQGVKKMYTRML